MKRASLPSSPGRAAAAAVLGLVLASCIGFTDEHITDVIRVTNGTATTLQFRIVTVEGGSFDLVRPVAPGVTFDLLSGSQLSPGAGLAVDFCTAGDLIALDPSGREIARHPPPLCAGSTWVIGGPTSPSP